MGGTCLFLATKVEEASRKLRDVTIACTKVASKNLKLFVDEQSKEFWRWKDTILLNEEVLLEALAFDLTLDSPYVLLSKFVEFLNIPNTAVRKGAWAFVNDSCRTTLCVMFPTKVIAAAAIHWALMINKTEAPISLKWKDKGAESPDHWWEHSFINVEENDMVEACKVMVDHYESQTTGVQTQPKIPQSSSNSNTDAKRKQTDEEATIVSKKPKLDS